MRTKTDSQFIGKSQVFSAGGCYAISFFRPSGTNQDVSINGVPLAAGTTVSFGQNVGDEDHTEYEVVFANVIGSSNELYVRRIIPIKTNGKPS